MGLPSCPTISGWAEPLEDGDAGCWCAGLCSWPAAPAGAANPARETKS